MSLAELPIAQARRGDRRAQRAIYDALEVPVMRYAMVATRRDREAAKDIVQEVFVRAFASLDRLEDPAKLRSWVFAIAANVVRTRVAVDARRREVLALYALEAEVDASDDPLEREAGIARVRALVAEIEDPQVKRIVELKYGDPEHTTRGIAEKLAIPHGTVTVKLMRFRARIKARLVAALAEEGA